MNSLTELNGYAANKTLPYTDLRSPNVLFDSANAANQTQTVNEGFAFNSSVGIEISEIINGVSSAPTYTIDVSNVPGTVVSWATLPNGITLSVPSAGVYTLSGMTDVSQWDLIKYGSINLPANYFGVWTYVSSINYYNGVSGNQQQAWTTAVTVNDVQFLTTPVSFTYTVDAVSNITNTPQLANLDASYPGATWTVTGTPSSTASIDTWTTTGTGGTFSVNATTKVFTISGTRTQVNSRLAGLQIDANATSTDFALTYVAANNQNTTTDTKIQLMNSVGLLYLGQVTAPAIYFDEDDTNTPITGSPLITDALYDGSGGYVYKITPSDVAAVESMASIGATGTSSFNSTTKVLTITGTRTEVNNRLATLSMVPGIDWGSEFTLTYSVVTPRYDTASKIQVLLCATNDTEVSNMNISRNYVANNGNTIFASNTPQIIDLDTAESTYTISFAVNPSLGTFNFSANDTPSSNLSFTGTRAQCNAKFANLRFWPAVGVSSNGTFTYTQLKDGVEQVSQVIGLIGSAGTFNNSRTVELTVGQTYTPEVGDYLYANAELFLLGGGGGGAYSGGGGGGGQVYTVQNVSLSATSYTIVIGGGGAPGTSSASNTGANGGITSGFGHAVAGGLGGGSNGGNGSGVYAGTGGTSGSVSGTYYGGGGGAGGGGIDNTYNQNGGSYTEGSTRYGVGGTFNGTTFNNYTNYGLSSFAGGGSGGTSSATARTAQLRAGRGACGSSVAIPAVDSWGCGGGGGYNGKPGSSGGSGRITIRFYPK